MDCSCEAASYQLSAISQMAATRSSPRSFSDRLELKADS
jgi:hypothetical protein